MHMVSALVSESSDLGSSPGRGYCVVFLPQDTLVTQFLSPPKWTSIPFKGE